MKIPESILRSKTATIALIKTHCNFFLYICTESNEEIAIPLSQFQLISYPRIIHILTFLYEMKKKKRFSFC